MGVLDWLKQAGKSVGDWFKQAAPTLAGVGQTVGNVIRQGLKHVPGVGEIVNGLSPAIDAANRETNKYTGLKF